ESLKKPQLERMAIEAGVGAPGANWAEQPTPRSLQAEGRGRPGGGGEDALKIVNRAPQRIVQPRHAGAAAPGGIRPARVEPLVERFRKGESACPRLVVELTR